jgi:4-amino-4-deoxy-L-arabinose transferase-like glycosyltransferase
MLLTFFSTLGVFLFLKNKPLWGWIFLALAFLTKGPVGVGLPLLVLFVMSLLQGSFKNGFKLFWERVYSPLGWFLFLLIAPSWYLLMLYKFGWEYFYKFFVLENIARFTGKLGRHIYPWWYYIPVVLTSTVLFIPAWFSSLRRFKEQKPLWGWFLTVFTFYSLSKGKLHHYVLFAYPPLAGIFAKNTSKRCLKIAFTLGVVLFSSLLAGAVYLEKQRFTPKAVEVLKRKNPQRLFFYKTENSAIVFYLYRCIPEVGNPKLFQAGDYVITDTKHLEELINFKFQILVKGKEFKREEVLLKILK